MSRRLRILAADDEDAILEGYRRVLLAVGDVDVASDGRTAMTLVAQHCYDVIVSDVVMPGLDGDELLVLAHQRCPDTQVVLVTGAADDGRAARAVEAGAFAYLVKPVDLPALTTTVRRAAVVAREKQQQPTEDPMHRPITEKTRLALSLSTVLGAVGGVAVLVWQGRGYLERIDGRAAAAATKEDVRAVVKEALKEEVPGMIRRGVRLELEDRSMVARCPRGVAARGGDCPVVARER